MEKIKRVWVTTVTLLSSSWLPETQAAAYTDSWAPQTQNVACTSASGGSTQSRYCNNGSGQTFNIADTINGVSQGLDYEFFEGDTSQSMFGVFFKERCTANPVVTGGNPTIQYCYNTLTCGGSSGNPIDTSLRSLSGNSNNEYTGKNSNCYVQTASSNKILQYCFMAGAATCPSNGYVAVMSRIRRIWQFPNYSPVSPLASDVSGKEAQVFYTSSDPIVVANFGWMMADVVPLNNCAYVVSQSTQLVGTSLKINYNFEQWRMIVQVNSAIQQRAVMMVQNYARTFTTTITSGRANDILRTGEKVFYYPYWGGFYWVTQGKLAIKIDLTFPTSDTLVQDSDVANPALDPCTVSTPLFKCASLNPYSDAGCIKHVLVDAFSLGGNTVTGTVNDMIIDHVWVYKMMYIVVGGAGGLGGAPRTIWKVQGNPRSAGAQGTLTYTNYYTYTSSTLQIISLQSLEQFGFFITTLDTTTQITTVSSWQLYMQSNGNGGLSTDANGDYIELTASRIITTKNFDPSITSPPYLQQLLQQSSYMRPNKPIYAVAGKSSDLVTYRNKIYTYTSFIQQPPIFIDNQLAQNGQNRYVDYYQYGIQTRQFHMFSIQPGAITDNIATPSSIDYNKIYATVIDLTDGYEDEVMRWPLHGCGDAFYNSSDTFEQCDWALTPPRNSYKYPSTANWLRKDVWYDDTTKNYYTCSDICQMQSVSLCGDGYESNGPSQTDAREECDDGNNVSGDGCSSTCTIENEYECIDAAGNKRWGPGSCTPKCGNGIIDDPYAQSSNTALFPLQVLPDGNDTPSSTGIVVEECDMGAWNYNLVTLTGSVPQYPCSKRCQKRGVTKYIDYHLWTCTISGTGRSKISTCNYNCGNKWLNTEVFEPCDLLAQPWTQQTPTTQYVNNNAGWDWNTTANPTNDVSKNAYFTNKALNLGCSMTCTINTYFICPLDNSYMKRGSTDATQPDLRCSDRAQDGEFDGPYSYVGRGTDQQVYQYTNYNPPNYAVLRITQYWYTDTNGYFQWTYNTWDSTNGMTTNQRVLTEDCDTNGDLTCCDRMGKIVTGCTCTHFFIGMRHNEGSHGAEIPSYRSLCVNPSAIAYYTALPSNTFYFQNKGISLNANVGLNGQLRLMECSDSTTCFGAMFGYQAAGSTGSYFNQFGTLYKLSSTSSVVSSQVTQSTGALKGKQRNTFGSYAVYNENLQTITINQLTSTGYAGSGKTFTSTAEAAIQLLGSHEIYYWGYGSQLMVKLSDGISFKFYRLASDFQTVCTQSSPTNILKIQQTFKNIFHQPDYTVVPPVFVQNVAVFFVVTSSNVGYLYFYTFNSVSNFFEKTTSVMVDSTVASGWQTTTSLIRTTTGVIFKGASDTTITHYSTTTFAATTLTLDTNGMTVGTSSLANLVLMQQRDDPTTYSTSETAPPTILGFMNNNYVMQLSYTGTTLQVTSSISIPCQTTQTACIASTSALWLTSLSSQWFDVGATHFAVMSPVNCVAKKGSTTITNASVRVYDLTTVADIDTNDDGYVDSTQLTDNNGDGVINTSDYTAVNYSKGWTCMDVPTTFLWQQDLTNSWTWS